MARRKVNKSKLVREALAKGLTSAAEIVAAIKQEYGEVVREGLIHNIKSAENKKKGGRKPAPAPASSAPAPAPASIAKPQAAANGSGATLTVTDVTAVKGLLSRLGRQNVEDLIAALA